MIQTLDGMFAKSSSASRKAVIRALMNTRMTRGSVRDHCLAMMSHINRAEVMGATLEEEMKIDIILESLSDSFNQFKMNYNMNKLNLTPTQLMHELDSAKKSLVKPASVHFAEGSIKPIEKPKAVVLVTKLTTMKKPKGRCFKCGQKDHWKKDCIMVKKKSSIGDLNVV